MDTNRLTYLVKNFFQHTASDAEQQELASIILKARGDGYLKKVLEEVWEQYQPQQQMPGEMSDRIVGKIFQSTVTPATDPQVAEPYETRPLVKRMTIWKYAGIAASFVLLLSITWWFAKGHQQQEKTITAQTHIISTQKGKRSRVVLPDSTIVWLNAGSHLEYKNDFGEHDRKVQLSGEAFFDVTHDTKKPFLISTAVFELKVLGTTFNVRAYPEEKHTEAALITGMLEVSFASEPSKKIILKPTEKISVDTQEDTVDITPMVIEHKPAISSVTYQPGDSSVIETSWVKNKLVFRNKPFEEVALEMSRWYNVNLDVRDKALLAKRFTGTFETETIYEALTSLSASYNFWFVYDKDKKVFIIDK